MFNSDDPESKSSPYVCPWSFQQSSSEEEVSEYKVWHYIYCLKERLKGNSVPMDMYLSADYGVLFFDIPVKELSVYEKFTDSQLSSLNELLQLLKDEANNENTIQNFREWYLKGYTPGSVKKLINLMKTHEASKIGSRILETVRKPRLPRRHPVIMNFIKSNIKKNKKLTADDLWTHIQRHSDYDALGVPGGEIEIQNGRLKVFSKKHGDKAITCKTFKEYFRICKNPPTRAK